MGAIAEDYEDRAYGDEPEIADSASDKEIYDACLASLKEEGELPAIVKGICEFYEKHNRVSEKQRNVLLNYLNQ